MNNSLLRTVIAVALALCGLVAAAYLTLGASFRGQLIFSPPTLTSVVVAGAEVTITYGKNSNDSVCAHLKNEQGVRVHTGNLFCDSGPSIVKRQLLTEVRVVAGQRVQLCRGNTPALCSGFVSVLTGQGGGAAPSCPSGTRLDAQQCRCVPAPQCDFDERCEANQGETMANCPSDCRPVCLPPDCVAPPEGCRYVDSVFDANRCQTSCGRMMCDPPVCGNDRTEGPLEQCDGIDRGVCLPDQNCTNCQCVTAAPQCKNTRLEAGEDCERGVAMYANPCSDGAQCDYETCKCPAPVCRKNYLCEAGETFANCPSDCACAITCPSPKVLDPGMCLCKDPESACTRGCPSPLILDSADCRCKVRFPTAEAAARSRPCGRNATQGSCGLFGLDGINWNWRCGDTGLYRSVRGICESNGINSSSVIMSSKTCVSWEAMQDLVAAECAKRQCSYPMVCATVTIDFATIEKRPGMCPSKIGYARGTCSDGAVVQETWRSCGVEDILAVSTLERFCKGRGMQTCRPGTSADYPNGLDVNPVCTLGF